MKLIEVLALMPPTQPGTEPNPTGQMLQMVGMFVILGVMFYFLLIRPQQKQRKDQENMIKNVKSGDRILTTGGIYGIVTNVKEKSLMVKIADNVKVEIAKSAIGSVVQKSAESDGSSS
jgi:preprotein translocase subunit YajC